MMNYVSLAFLVGFLTIVTTPMSNVYAMKWGEDNDLYGCRSTKSGKVKCPEARGTFDFNFIEVPNKPRACRWKRSKSGGSYQCHYSKCMPEQWWCSESPRASEDGS
jgi:hypothetical protein